MASVGSDCHLDRMSRTILPIQTDNRVATTSASVVDAYLTHLTVERRLAANSVESYARDLGLLAEFAAGRGTPIASLTRADLEGFVRDLMSEGRSPRSVARAIACYRGFYRFLVVDGRLKASPAGDLRPPRAWKTLPRYLAVEEVDRLLAQPDVATPRGLRDRALIELLYATGMRVSELIGLRPADVNLDASYLTCTGKGDKQRIVPIGDEAARWVRRYLRDGAAGAARQAKQPAAVRQRARRRARADARRILEDPQGLRPPGRPEDVDQPAHAAAFVRHAPARAGRRPARHPDDARPRRPVDDADLHARARAADANASMTSSIRERKC